MNKSRCHEEKIKSHPAGGSEKNEINAILNSVGVKVEVGVELGNNEEGEGIHTRKVLT